RSGCLSATPAAEAIPPIARQVSWQASPAARFVLAWDGETATTLRVVQRAEHVPVVARLAWWLCWRTRSRLVAQPGIGWNAFWLGRRHSDVPGRARRRA